MIGVSFIITTSGTNDSMVNTVIDSIESEKLDQYEIIIVGGDTTSIDRKCTQHIPFDESQKAHIILHGYAGRWTTRKKNIGISAAKFDVVIPMHDYVKINPGWKKGFYDHGLDWDICNHQCLLSNGVRADGWRINTFPGLPKYCMIPYDIEIFVPYMMIQGNYWAAKKSTMLKFPLDENLLWGMEEDAEWSRRVIPKCKINMNANCIVQYLKPRPDDASHAVDVNTMNSYNHYWNDLRSMQTKYYKLCRE